MSTKLAVTEFVRNFAEYLNRVVYRGERFVLVRGRREVAELRPLPMGTRLSELPGLLAGLPRLSAEEAESLAEDLDRARAELPMLPERVWES